MRYHLRRHQAEALAALDRAFAAGRRRAWVVLPPGAGKTYTGLVAAHRLGGPVVVFGPNTAIQGQWVREWAGFGQGSAGTWRTLESQVTVLTYQSLASFDPDAEIDEDGADATHLARLRPQGRELVAAMRALGRVTLLLDECHHLLDTWGELVAEVLEELPEATVIGLTATPPDRLTAAEAKLVDDLFGPVIQGPSIPAVVREGHLAPYAELAWLTRPTADEDAWLAAGAERFTELTTDLLNPAFATVPFLDWLDARIVRRAGKDGDEPALPWRRFERQDPELADAGLRFHFAGLLAMPAGARVREEHRHAPTAADWVCLLDDYVRKCLKPSEEAVDEAAIEAIRAALPAVGYRLTARGIRAGRTPVDRVVARSEAKTRAVAEILAAEHASLGERMRGLVLCDHENASATLPARLAGVLDEEAGSARLVLEILAADARTAILDPMLVTGKTVAASAATARAFFAFCAEQAPRTRLDPVEAEEGVVEITGSWSSGTWVALATRFIESGGTNVLIGTRAMLGEGWDARCVNTVVDLTEATTATSVVQTRGRALRLDPGWPQKVAHTWSVVCVSEQHPKGLADYERFVRKHDGYFGLTETGAIMAGVAHVHPELSPYAPPAHADFDRLNVSMLRRSEDRGRARELWRVGSPYEDVHVHSLRVTPARPRTTPAPVGARPRPPVLLPMERGAGPLPRAGWRPGMGTGATVAGLVTVAAALLQEPVVLVGLAAALVGWALARERKLAVVGDEILREVAERFDLPAMAYAVADALHKAGLIPRGAEGVAVEPDETGSYRVELRGVPLVDSQRFALALDEVISPPVRPRYVIPRYVVSPGLRAGRRLMKGRAEENTVVYHAVPEALTGNVRSAGLFGDAWNHWVSAGRPIYGHGPKGDALLLAQGGGSPLDVSTAMRVSWA